MGRSRPKRRRVSELMAVMMALAPASIDAWQGPPSPINPPPPPKPASVERLGPDLLRVGSVRVDTDRKEIAVTGAVNDVPILEFFANTKGGFKAYESALELDTNAIDFNLGLILIGLDPARGGVPRFQFDPGLPKGDPVEIWVEWDSGGSRRRVRAEELVFNEDTKRTLEEGPWVYTGSFFPPGSDRFLAELDGTLIGLMHAPSPLIENGRPLPGPYGRLHLNPGLGLSPGTKVVVTVRALPRAKE
jgi:hypothetical protein